MRKKTTSKVPKASKAQKTTMGQGNKAKKKSTPAPATADTPAPAAVATPAAVAVAVAAKATRPTRKRASKKRGVRYSPEQQAEIVQFVQDYNTKHGRAGQATASKKYGVSAFTISKWTKSSGRPAKKKGQDRSGRPGRPGQPTPTTAASPHVPGADGIERALRRMLEIQTEMEALRAEYVGLRDRL